MKSADSGILILTKKENNIHQFRECFIIAPKGVIMELNLIGTLTMFKTMGMLPNFSELARTFVKTGIQSKICMTERRKNRERKSNLSLNHIKMK